MATEGSYVCESCGTTTTGDSLCTKCLHTLQEAAHHRPSIAEVRAACVDSARRIHDRISTIVASRAYTAAAEFREAVRAAGAIEDALALLVSQSRDGAPRERLAEGVQELVAGVGEWSSYARALLLRLETLARDAHARTYCPAQQGETFPLDPQGVASPTAPGQASP